MFNYLLLYVITVQQLITLFVDQDKSVCGFKAHMCLFTHLAMEQQYVYICALPYAHNDGPN